MTDKQFQADFAASFKSLAEKLTKETNNIMATVNKAILSGNKSFDYWTGIRAEVDNAYNRILKEFSTWSKKALPEQLAKYSKDVLNRMKALERLSETAIDTITSYEKAAGTASITAPLYKSAIEDLAKAVTSGKANMARFTRMTQQKLVDEFVFDSAVAKAYETGDLRNIMQVLTSSSPTYKKLSEGIGLLEVNGRMYDPVYYVEMVGRTKFHEAQSIASLNVTKQYGSDLVIVSSHNTDTPLCQEHEGKIYSISGDSDKYDKLEVTPPFHPNCLHLLYPYFETALEAEQTND